MENGEDRLQAAAMQWGRSVRNGQDAARLLTAGELEALPRGAVVWIEHLNGETGRSSGPVCAMKCGDGTLVDEEALIYDDFREDMKLDAWGHCWRFWSAVPTEEQRAGTPWPEPEG